MKTLPRPFAVELLEDRIAPASLAYVNPTTATYTDPDGDAVTVKFTKPILSAANVGHVLIVSAIDSTHDQLQTIDLTATDLASSAKGTGITVSAKPTATVGDGLAHIGYIKATGLDLGTVAVHGDLGAIDCGDNVAATPGLAKLSAQSMGVFGLTTGAPDLESDINGSVGSVVLLTHLQNASLLINGAGAKLGSITLGGSIFGTSGLADAGLVYVNGSIGTVKVGGDVQGGGGTDSGAIIANAAMGNVTIGGSLVGGDGGDSGEILMLLNNSSMGAVTIGGDIRGGPTASHSFTGVVDSHGTIKSVTVGGSLMGGPGGDSGEIVAFGSSLGPVKIAGDVIGGTGSGLFSGVIDSHGKMPSVTIGGSLLGGTNGNSGLVLSYGDMGAVQVGGYVQGGSGGSSGFIQSMAKLANVKVAGSVLGGTGIDSGQIESALDMGSVTIGGDLVGADATGSMNLFCSGLITSEHRIGSVTIGGSVVSGTNTSANPLFDDGAIRAGDDLGKLIVKGSLIGNGSHPVVITGRGQLHPSAASDLAIGSVTVLGSATYANILAGYNNSFAPTGENGHAQIGSITIGTDWIASNAVAGAQNLGTDGAEGGTGTNADNVNFGNAQDQRIPVTAPGPIAKIASISIGGLIYGTDAGANAADHFGFVAQQIASFKLASQVIPLTANSGNDSRDLGPSGDVTIHEVQ